MPLTAWLVAFRAFAVSADLGLVQQALVGSAGITPTTAAATAKRIKKSCAPPRKPRSAKPPTPPQPDPTVIAAQVRAAVAPALSAAQEAQEAASHAIQVLEGKADAEDVQRQRRALRAVKASISQPKRPYWAWAAGGLAAASLVVAIWRAPSVQAARTLDSISVTYLGIVTINEADAHQSLIDGEHSCTTPVQAGETFAEGRQRHLEAVEAFRKVLLEQTAQ